MHRNPVEHPDERVEPAVGTILLHLLENPDDSIWGRREDVYRRVFTDDAGWQRLENPFFFLTWQQVRDFTKDEYVMLYTPEEEQ